MRPIQEKLRSDLGRAQKRRFVQHLLNRRFNEPPRPRLLRKQGSLLMRGHPALTKAGNTASVTDIFETESPPSFRPRVHGLIDHANLSSYDSSPSGKLAGTGFAL